MTCVLLITGLDLEVNAINNCYGVVVYQGYPGRWSRHIRWSWRLHGPKIVFKFVTKLKVTDCTVTPWESNFIVKRVDWSKHSCVNIGLSCLNRRGTIVKRNFKSQLLIWTSRNYDFEWTIYLESVVDCTGIYGVVWEVLAINLWKNALVRSVSSYKTEYRADWLMAKALDFYRSVDIPHFWLYLSRRRADLVSVAYYPGIWLGQSDLSAVYNR